MHYWPAPPRKCVRRRARVKKDVIREQIVYHHGQQLARGEIAGEHLMHLFDEPASRVETVSGFLLEGWHKGNALVVVAKASHWSLLARRLEANGCPVPEYIAAGRLMVLEAGTTLAAFMKDEAPDPAEFVEHVGGVVRRAGARGRGVRVYGEIVEILAEQGNLMAADQLEALWSALALEYSLTLLCGYNSAHFIDARTTPAFDAIRRRHTRAAAKPTDLLGSWLLGDRQSRFHIETSGTPVRTETPVRTYIATEAQRHRD
jgi:hypothetical protein